jgi:nucleotide-binding universal stress UspA family protein
LVGAAIEKACRRSGRLFVVGIEMCIMHVLLGVGGDDRSLQALSETVQRARAAGDDLTVAVYSDADGLTRGDVETSVRERLDELGYDAEVRPLEGDPGSSLVALAEEESFDRIALAGGHRSPLGKIQLDPVSEFVLLNATTTVTLIR